MFTSNFVQITCWGGKIQGLIIREHAICQVKAHK